MQLSILMRHLVYVEDTTTRSDNMERDLIRKIKDLIDNEEELENATWYVNMLNQYGCTFDYQDRTYIVSIEEVE